MKKFITCLSFLLVFTANAFSQQHITGRIIDKESGDGIFQATLQLLKTDSAFVSGVVSDDEGHFRLAVEDAGSFIVKITSVGYKTYTKKVNVVKGKDLDMGTISIATDAILLKEVTATGQAAQAGAPFGTQTVAPSSMSAWVKSPQRPAG